MKIKHLFDSATYTLTYIVYDQDSKDAIIIDPVLDFDPASGAIATTSLSILLQEVANLNVNVRMILETHAHADHLSSSQRLKEHFPGAILAIGEGIRKVQETFKPIFNMGDSFSTDGSQFDRLLKDREIVTVGTLQFEVIFTPGHTPACASYFFEGAVFTGDALFMPDYGTGRCDFPAGSAHDLYASVHENLYKLPESTEVYVGHDYMPGGRELAFKSTIKEEKEKNIQLSQQTTENEFVAMRQTRDQGLSAPRLLYPSVQVNINAGELPQSEANGKVYLKIPVKL